MTRNCTKVGPWVAIVLIATTLVGMLTWRSPESSDFFQSIVDAAKASAASTNACDPPPTTISNPLDGCYHVYLDVGSNIGIQVSHLIYRVKKQMFIAALR
jgi:hypothetical protein